MSHTLPTNFPDEEYLKDLVDHTRKKFEQHHSTVDQLLMYSGGVLNWVADYITDQNVEWKKEEIAIRNLYLTGMGPEENIYIIEKAERSPVKLYEILQQDVEAQRIFNAYPIDALPILIRYEDEKWKVLNGMHRVIAAIREDKQTISAYVARLKGTPKPQIEAHVIYDLLRAYDRGITNDRAGLVAALRYLRGAYANVDQLLRERFSDGWMPHKDVQEVIEEALST